MKYNVILADQFTASFRNSCDYITQVLYQEQAAARLVKKVEEAITGLSEFPLSCPLCEDKLGQRGYRKCVIGNYLIIYEVNELTKTIIVTNFVFAQSDYLNKL